MQDMLLCTAANDIKFEYRAGDTLTSSITLRSLCNKGRCIAFKLKTNAPHAYTVSKASSMLRGGQSVHIRVYMQPHAAPDHVPHAFLVQVRSEEVNLISTCHRHQSAHYGHDLHAGCRSFR